MALLFGLLPLLLMACALIDAITRPDDEVRHLPKLIWILLIIVIPLIGGLLWFAIGREYPAHQGAAQGPSPHRAPAQRTGQGHSRPAASSTSERTLSTEEQLEQLDREIAYYDAQDRIRKLEEEIERKRRDGE